MAFRGPLWYKMHELSHQMPISNLLNDINNMFWLQPHGNFMNTSFTADQLSPQCPLYIYFVTNQMCKTLSGWFVGVLFLFCSCGVVLLLVLLCLALFTFVYGIEFIVLCPHSKNKRNLDLLVVVCVVSPGAVWRKKCNFLHCQNQPSWYLLLLSESCPEYLHTLLPTSPVNLLPGLLSTNSTFSFVCDWYRLRPLAFWPTSTAWVLSGINNPVKNNTQRTSFHLVSK